MFSCFKNTKSKLRAENDVTNLDMYVIKTFMTKSLIVKVNTIHSVAAHREEWHFSDQASLTIKRTVHKTKVST